MIAKQIRFLKDRDKKSYEMKRCEYEMRIVYQNELQKILNSMGQQGWQLIQLTVIRQTVMFGDDM